MLPFMFMGKIQAFEDQGASSINQRLWEGGIREIVLGDLVLSKGNISGPAFAPNRELYENTSGQPPELPQELEKSSRIFRDSVDSAANKGFKIYFHDWG